MKKGEEVLNYHSNEGVEIIRHRQSDQKPTPIPPQKMTLGGVDLNR